MKDSNTEYDYVTKSWFCRICKLENCDCKDSNIEKEDMQDWILEETHTIKDNNVCCIHHLCNCHFMTPDEFVIRVRNRALREQKKQIRELINKKLVNITQRENNAQFILRDLLKEFDEWSETQ